MEDELKTNIDYISKGIKENTIIEETNTYDGISLECKIPDKKTFKQCKTSIEKYCKQNKLLPVAFEQRDDREKYFLVQFPELIPYYTEEQLHNMFFSSLEYLISTNIELSKRSGVIVTRKMLIDTIEKYVTEVIKMYYNWNVNKYRETLDGLLNNINLRNSIKRVFNEVIVKYV